MHFKADKFCTTYPDGSRVFHTPGPFKNIAKVENCICGDGKRRTVRATGYGDGETIPARITFRFRALGVSFRKTISGVLYIGTYNEKGHERPEFASFGKNAWLLDPNEPSWYKYLR